MKLTLLCGVLTLLAVSGATADTITLGSFSSGDLRGWEAQTFPGRSATGYRLVTDEGRTVIMAESRGSASGLIRKVRLDSATYPILRWSWKIHRTLPRGDEWSRSGDDYAARVYVLFPRTLFWQTRAISYIWANRLPQGQALANAYTGNLFMIAVQSGNQRAGTWVTEERNLRDDYRRLFGQEPPLLGGIAIMTDSDDSAGEATAWYGDISLTSKH